MNPFRLFLAAALSSMAVYGNESAYVGRDETRALEGEKNPDDGEDDGELTPALPEYGQRQCFELPTEIERIRNKDYEKFNKYKRDDDWKKIMKKYTKKKIVEDYKPSIPIEKTPKDFQIKYLCKQRCAEDERCINVYSSKTDRPTFQCLRPCYRQCSRR